MFDYFGFTLAILLGSIITYKTFYVFWIGPIYLVYLLAKKGWSFAGTEYKEEDQQMTSREKKVSKRQRA